MMPGKVATRLWLAIAVVVGWWPSLAAAQAADSEAAARKHAARANLLAAKNKCKLALPWFNRAYRTLKDPTLLFNRAECLRKLGEDNDALRDYELFLAESPAAPNRAAVEARIAALLAASKAGAAGAGAAPAPTKEPSGAAGKEPAAAARAEDKPPASKAPPAAEKAPAGKTSPPAAQPAEKAPAAPARRAEKWTD
jgi:hypothetical protein